MFTTFFHELKAAKVPVTLKEYLMLMEALKADLADGGVALEAVALEPCGDLFHPDHLAGTRREGHLGDRIPGRKPLDDRIRRGQHDSRMRIAGKVAEPG